MLWRFHDGDLPVLSCQTRILSIGPILYVRCSDCSTLYMKQTIDVTDRSLRATWKTSRELRRNALCLYRCLFPEAVSPAKRTIPTLAVVPTARNYNIPANKTATSTIEVSDLNRTRILSERKSGIQTDRQAHRTVPL